MKQGLSGTELTEWQSRGNTSLFPILDLSSTEQYATAETRKN